jgi:hypothetical protein
VRALFFVFVVMGLVCAAPAPILGAEKKRKGEPELPTPPPQPVPQKIDVPRTSNAQVILKIYGRQSETLRFLIRVKPEHGKITEIKPAGREAAVLFYQPPADLAVRSDRFAYAVQSSAGVSAPAEISINIMDEAPRLIVPDTVRFPATLAGSAARQELTIYNDGGAMAEGEALVDPPWRIEGSPSYRLARGDRRSFTLLFEPPAGGEMRREVRYSSHPDRVTTLLGEARAPLSVWPPSLQLRTSGDSPARFATAEIANQTGMDQVVEVKAGSRWRAPASLSIPAQGKEILLVKLAQEDTAAVDEEIALNGAGISLRLKVQAPVSPARLQPETEKLTLPASSGRNAAGQVVVRNLGGSPGFWRATIAAPFSANPAEVRLPPQAQAAITVRLESADPGHHSAPLLFTGELQTVRVPVEADTALGVAAMPASAAPVRIDSAPRVPSRVEPAPPPPPELTGEEYQPPPPGTSQVRVLEASSARVRLDWPEALTGGRALQIEVQKLSLDADRKLKVEWLVQRDVRMRKQDGRVEATVRGLPPNALQTIRGSALDAQTRTPQLLFRLDVLTAAGPGLLRPTATKGVVAVVLLYGGFVAWRFWRRRGAEQAG